MKIFLVSTIWFEEFDKFDDTVILERKLYQLILYSDPCQVSQVPSNTL